MVRKIYPPKSVTPDIAYLCGVFAGDGSLNYRKIKNEYLLKCVGNPKDEREFYYNVILPKFEKAFKLKLRVRYLDSGTTFGFIVYSKELFIYLTKTIGLPFGKKYDNLVIPEVFNKDSVLLTNFVRGVFDTDGCITFKKRHKDKPYYPVISVSSKSDLFIKQIVKVLKGKGLKPVEIYNYKVKDHRVSKGFTVINRIELNGRSNLEIWVKNIGFFSPKHINKIRMWKGNSGGWI